MAMTDPVGNLLHNVMHSLGTDSATGWITVVYTGSPAKQRCMLTTTLGYKYSFTMEGHSFVHGLLRSLIWTPQTSYI